MVDSINEIFSGASTTGTQSPSSVNQSEGEKSKTEFLQLLVTQLQNQDPLNPIENNQFAVDLAQFSQLEQLIDINEKLETSPSGDSLGGSLASYLGTDVSYASDSIEVQAGSARSIRFGLPSDSTATTVEILNDQGEVVKTLTLGAMEAGRQTVELNDLGIEDGSYGFKVKAQLSNGDILNPDTFLVGRVTGFVPGPSAALLIGDDEIALADIVEVRSGN